MWIAPSVSFALCVFRHCADPAIAQFRCSECTRAGYNDTLYCSAECMTEARRLHGCRSPVKTKTAAPSPVPSFPFSVLWVFPSVVKKKQADQDPVMSVTEILCAIAKQPREMSPVPPAVFDINGECECEWCTRGAPCVRSSV